MTSTGNSLWDYWSWGKQKAWEYGIQASEKISEYRTWTNEVTADLGNTVAKTANSAYNKLPTQSEIAEKTQEIVEFSQSQPPPKGLLRTAKEATLNFAAETASLLGFGDTEEIEAEALDEELDLDLDAIAGRIDAEPPTDEEFQHAVKKFGSNIARVVPMRLIDQFWCGTLRSEDFYLDMSYDTDSDGALKDAYFQHLDRSNLFFLTRWVAKIAYVILFPLFKRTVQESTISVFKNLEVYFEKNKDTEFNELLNQQVTNSNALLEDWIVSLQTVAKEVKDVKSIDRALTEEFEKSEYYDGLSREDFYRQVTKKLVDNFYVNVSLGGFVYSRLMDLRLPYPVQICKIPVKYLLMVPIFLINTIIKIVLFPVALVMRILLLLPDYVMNRVLANVIEKAMIRNNVVEDIVGQVQEGISTNKGISTPALQALVSSLEEIYFCIAYKKVEEDTDSQDEESLTTKNVDDEVSDSSSETPLPETEPTLLDNLSEKNQELLTRNVELSIRAANLYGKKTIEHLKLGIDEKGPGHHDEIAKGIEQVIVLLYQKLTDLKFLKQNGYYALEAFNDSLTIRPESAEIRDQEYKRLEKRLFLLIQTILVTSISSKVSEGVKAYGMEEEGAFKTFMANRIFSKTNVVVKKIINMVSSPNFIQFHVRAGLVLFNKSF